MLPHMKISGMAIIAALSLFWLTTQFAPREIDNLMNNQLGQRNYEVLQQGHPVGFLRTATRQTKEKNWEMTQNLQINMLNAPGYTSRQVMLFSSVPPYELISANFRRQSQGLDQQVTLDKIDSGYSASIQRSGTTESDSTERSAVDWTFTLRDQLSLERQLTEQTPIGSSVTSQYLDIQQLRVSEREHRLDQRSPLGFILKSDENDSVTELDIQRRLIRFTAPHQFSFQLTQRHQDELRQRIAPSCRMDSKYRRSSATDDLLQPAKLSTLTLALNTSGPLSLQEQGLPDTLSATASPKRADAKAAGFSIHH